MIRAGMVGLDTSHAIEFTKIFQDSDRNAGLQDVQIVAAFPAGSEIPVSRQRVSEFTRQVEAAGVEIVDSLSSLLRRVDVVMLESVDGGVHLPLARPILEAGKPLFIDKPLAHSVADAREIERCSEQNAVPCFSSSSLRFSPAIESLRACSDIGEVLGVATWGPCHLPAGVPDLYFYGIHGIEVLFTLMGSECRHVRSTRAPHSILASGEWSDQRIGTYRGIRDGSLQFGATIFGSLQNRTIDIGVPYRELCLAIAQFFRTGVAPVTLAETIKIYEFMDAANASHTAGGSSIPLKA
ncbi:MAG: Gfo/Idh/MocA family protein [Rubripirellula sp.]